jgi:hypothetical protein
MIAKRLLPALLVCLGMSAICWFVKQHARDLPILNPDEDLIIITKMQSHSHDDSKDFEAPNMHHHAVPNVLIFTHFINLLEYGGGGISSSSSAAEELYSKPRGDEAEFLALKKNVQHTISLHPNSTVRFLTDADCENSIRNALGQDTPLVEFFRREPRGMYKSDICRGAALWETGGLYFDVDLGVRMSVWNVLGTHTSFVTSKVHERSKQKPGFFQAFIGSAPHHPILLRYLQLFVKYYEGELTLETRLEKEHKQLLGVRLLHKAYSQIMEEQKEAKLVAKNKGGAKEKRRRLHEGTSEAPSAEVGAVELWQEVLYTPRKFPNVPEPTWGTKKSCKFVVVANHGWPSAVTFYSRIEGSRMCRQEDEQHQQLRRGNSTAAGFFSSLFRR